MVAWAEVGWGDNDCREAESSGIWSNGMHRTWWLTEVGHEEEKEVPHGPWLSSSKEKKAWMGKLRLLSSEVQSLERHVVKMSTMQLD